jgi:regulator of protease activity HflC (stomatin/prohibitin superfamily)
MKKFLIALSLAMMFATSACSKVPAGHVGVKVYLLGGSKGVNQETLGVGRYWIGMNEELYLFPTYQQNYTWTQPSEENEKVDESITFQTKEGMSVNADIGISYSLDPNKISDLFQKYRKGLGEITDTFLRNHVRDAVNDVASTMSVEEVYSTRKSELVDVVQKKVGEQVAAQGIIIDKIYLIGSVRLPANVVAALNSKIEATQRAQQRENELREAEAEAKKQVAKAEGEAKATLARAEAESKANQLKLRTLTRELIEYEAIQKWDGKLPTMTGNSAIPFINVK